jgi:hypothetical protein
MALEFTISFMQVEEVVSDISYISEVMLMLRKDICLKLPYAYSLAFGSQSQGASYLRRPKETLAAGFRERSYGSMHRNILLYLLLERVGKYCV